ncbi:nuclear transport factor 2 family protein [Chloroflexota bacterium]
MTIEELTAKVEKLEKELTTFRDIEEIQRLQRAYGYYLQHWMYEEIIDCFSDRPDTVLNILVGIYTGKEGIRRYFSGGKEQNKDPEFLHQVMQLSGIIDVAPDGETAEGRWYGFGAIALPWGKGVRQMFMGGIYESVYIKENGKWKIHKLTWNPVYTCYPVNGWVKPERLADEEDMKISNPPPSPDKPRNINSRYPSGYIVPFHFRHPVTGK